MHQIFEDRAEAGRRLAKRLYEFHNSDALILAIPRGGIPVAAAAAHRLGLEWNIIVARKLPIPSNPEAGFGAIAANGDAVLNKDILHGLFLSEARIREIEDEVRAEVIRRTELYSKAKPPPDVFNRCVIVLDDGLASGYTMLAAMKGLRARSASKIIAASPVASRSAAALVEQAADQCVFEIISPAVPFAVADFYLDWHDLTDDNILPILGK